MTIVDTHCGGIVEIDVHVENGEAEYLDLVLPVYRQDTSLRCR